MFKRTMRILNAIFEYFEGVGRLRAWAELKLLSDHTLQRMGLSPELVKKGPEHWPWRAESGANGTLGAEVAAVPTDTPDTRVQASAPPRNKAA